MAIIPTISIYVPTIRPQYWKRLYDSLSRNDVLFEIIFVGHIPPDYVLPENVKYINSSVKPSQCAEIGFRACRGEFCIFALDDIVFGEHTLDILYNKFLEMGRDNVVISCMPYLNGKALDTCRYRFWDYDKNSPIQPLCGLYKRSIIEQLGGIDRNFVCSFWDIDLVMRLYEMGGISLFCPGAVANEIVIDIHAKDRLIQSGLHYDRSTLEFLWTISYSDFRRRNDLEALYINTQKKKGVILKHRLKLIEPFANEDILVRSQGPKGKWV